MSENNEVRALSAEEGREPLPCPFCGGAAEVFTDLAETWYRVTCCSDRCVELSVGRDTAAEAVAAWNRRAGATREQEAASALGATRVQEISKRVDEQVLPDVELLVKLCREARDASELEASTRPAIQNILLRATNLAVGEAQSPAPRATEPSVWENDVAWLREMFECCQPTDPSKQMFARILAALGATEPSTKENT